MAESLKVCLIGPAASGKTSLLATIGGAIADGVHGYSHNVQFVMKELSEEVVGAARRPRNSHSAFDDLKAPKGDLAERESQFRRGSLRSTDADRTYIYHLNLKRVVAGKTAEAETTRDLDLTIIDAAGELMFPEPPEEGVLPAREVYPDVYGQLIDLMRAADAVILVLRITLPENPFWKDEFNKIINALCEREGRLLKRFVVAFNQYETLFVRFGGSAFQYATRPLVAQHALREASIRAEWLTPLQRLRSSGIDVVFVPTSPYGFVKNFGNPNLTMVNGQMERFQHTNPMSPLWRPFCSADPFIFAATGDLSALMHDVGEMYPPSEGFSEPEPPPYDSGPAPKPPSNPVRNKRNFLRKFADIFNTNAGD
jgi:hypothetical protein